MNSILVTGGSGFIGSHTCLILLKHGFEIFVIDSFINSSSNSLKQILIILKKMKIDAEQRLHFFKGDLKNERDIDDIFIAASMKDKPIDSVIHFAGLKSVNESILNPLNYWENNVFGTINLLKIMTKYNCKNIVFR